VPCTCQSLSFSLSHTFSLSLSLSFSPSPLWQKKFNYLILNNAEKIPPSPTKSLIYINLTPAEEEKSEKNKKWFAPPNIWRLDFYIGRFILI
jgi:hypothetical protein